MKYFGPQHNYQPAGSPGSATGSSRSDPGLRETSAVCICPNCLEKFPKTPGQVCVNCRCPVCNVPLRNK